MKEKQKKIKFKIMEKVKKQQGDRKISKTNSLQKTDENTNFFFSWINKKKGTNKC